MSLRRLLSGLLKRNDGRVDSESTLYECRHCGTKLDEKPTTCPVCGATEIATYDLEDNTS